MRTSKSKLATNLQERIEREFSQKSMQNSGDVNVNVDKREIELDPKDMNSFAELGANENQESGRYAGEYSD